MYSLKVLIYLANVTARSLAFYEAKPTISFRPFLHKGWLVKLDQAIRRIWDPEQRFGIPEKHITILPWNKTRTTTSS